MQLSNTRTLRRLAAQKPLPSSCPSAPLRHSRDAAVARRERPSCHTLRQRCSIRASSFQGAPLYELMRSTRVARALHGSALGAKKGRTSFPSVYHCAETQVGSGMAPELRAAVEEFLTKNSVVLFMKGTKQFPQCGFSNTCVQVLNMMNVPYETVNILEDESLRSGMKEYSQWPTFPQLYINNEFVGGCDIVIESFQNGELQEMLEVAMSS